MYLSLGKQGWLPSNQFYALCTAPGTQRGSHHFGEWSRSHSEEILTLQVHAKYVACTNVFVRRSHWHYLVKSNSFHCSEGQIQLNNRTEMNTQKNFKEHASLAMLV